MQQTPHYALKKIELTDSPPDITVINPNWDKIDGELNSSANHQKDRIAHASYAVNTSGNDSYTVTLDGVTEYSVGMIINFKATIANTTTATLNVNGLGAKTIVRGSSTTLATGDILANTIITVVYDGTYFQLQSQGGDVATLAGTQTLTNKTLTAPKIANGGFIADPSGNEQVKFTQTSSAVNEFTVKNATTGNAPELQASGNDTNIDINLVPKGTGTVKAGGKQLALQETVDEHLADEIKHVTAAERTKWNDYEKKLSEYNFSVTTSDANGTPTQTQYRRQNNTLYLQVNATNPNANGNYQTITEKYYDNAGTNVVKTITWTLTYNSNGLVTSRSWAVS